MGTHAARSMAVRYGRTGSTAGKDACAVRYCMAVFGRVGPREGHEISTGMLCCCVLRCALHPAPQLHRAAGTRWCAAAVRCGCRRVGWQGVACGSCRQLLLCANIPTCVHVFGSLGSPAGGSTGASHHSSCRQLLLCAKEPTLHLHAHVC